MNSFETVLFDLDGTLTDPREGIINSIRYALKKFGIEEQDDQFLEGFIGPPLQDSFKRFYSFDEQKAMKAVEYYRVYFSKTGIYENKLYPGISQLLKKLVNLDKTLAVATSKPTVFAEQILKYFKLFDYFNLVVGSNLDGTRTAKKEIVEYVLDNLDKDNDRNAVMIGDRSYDVIGAKENGISSIGVLYGYGKTGELEEAGADYLVNTVAELTDLLT